MNHKFGIGFGFTAQVCVNQFQSGVFDTGTVAYYLLSSTFVLKMWEENEALRDRRGKSRRIDIRFLVREC